MFGLLVCCYVLIWTNRSLHCLLHIFGWVSCDFLFKVCFMCFVTVFALHCECLFCLMLVLCCYWKVELCLWCHLCPQHVHVQKFWHRLADQLLLSCPQILKQLQTLNQWHQLQLKNLYIIFVLVIFAYMFACLHGFVCMLECLCLCLLVRPGGDIFVGIGEHTLWPILGWHGLEGLGLTRRLGLHLLHLLHDNVCSVAGLFALFIV